MRGIDSPKPIIPMVTMVSEKKAANRKFRPKKKKKGEFGGGLGFFANDTSPPQ
jgi:hypothetical protein